MPTIPANQRVNAYVSVTNYAVLPVYASADVELLGSGSRERVAHEHHTYTYHRSRRVISALSWYIDIEAWHVRAAVSSAVYAVSNAA